MTSSSAIQFSRVVSWDNLLEAYRRASRGKRGKASTAAFDLLVGDELVRLQRDLQTLTYRPGPYVHFTIHDPKQRKISAAPFRDRVVHHALCNVIEPVFDRRFIRHSYANRTGKGTHRAIDAVQAMARQYRYVLRLDIVKHFPSIDHAIMADILRQVMDDERVMGLVGRILDSGRGVLDDEYDMVFFPGDNLSALHRPRGLPIGNLTSQFWSNVYLNPLDWFVVREMGCSAYVRYVDDMALFSDSKRQLYQWKQAIIQRLQHLRLTIHEAQAQVAPVEHGIPWLGFVVSPTHRRVKARNVVKFSRRLRERWADHCAGDITFAEFDASVQGWINHVRYADTWSLREHLLGQPLTRNQD